ncbi:MAG: [FeFe] hydrogenase H-cluster maturation GTPase HydF [Ruminococcaceae bacterium]|nr:[FeFe] hydrogenase H-cluster maturation GTPase HydF [Oscillospiraceae bacterium]
MGLNDTPSAERVHIAFFGRRNAGKSSLLNAVTQQNIAIVSEVQGTTTDPVYKAMELLPLGPVMLIDTAGIDDEGELGELRVKKTRQVLNKTDIAVLVVDATVGLSDFDRDILELTSKKEIPTVTVYNKADLLEAIPQNDGKIYVSADKNIGVNELRETIARLVSEPKQQPLISDLVNEGDMVLLIVPIDKAAPKGRLILPQQQVIRDLLDNNSVAIVAKENEVEKVLSSLKTPPSLAVTDSQIFPIADKKVPTNIPLTSFSILMARKKGLLKTAVKGAFAIEDLKDGDTVLIAEGCTHHKQCEDIGSVKIPRWIREYTGKDINFKTVSGTEFPEDLSEYSLIIHCGGCMLNEREVKYRMKSAEDMGIPITNYGTVIAYVKGILSRSIEIFGNLNV